MFRRAHFSVSGYLNETFLQQINACFAPWTDCLSSPELKRNARFDLVLLLWERHGPIFDDVVDVDDFIQFLHGLELLSHRLRPPHNLVHREREPIRCALDEVERRARNGDARGSLRSPKGEVELRSRSLVSPTQTNSERRMEER